MFFFYEDLLSVKFKEFFFFSWGEFFNVNLLEKNMVSSLGKNVSGGKNFFNVDLSQKKNYPPLGNFLPTTFYPHKKYFPYKIKFLP